MIIKARNLLDKSAPRSYLNTTVTSGDSSIYIYNINDFTANDAIQIGRTNEEKSEILAIGTATPSGTTLVTTGTARFDHPLDLPVYAIEYDKMVFKRSTAGTSGTATAMSDGTVDITPDESYTQFEDSSGAVSYAYKASYYNSITGAESSDSDWLEGTGFTFYSLGKMRKRVAEKLFDINYIQTDDTIDNWINEWLSEMGNIAVDVNKDYAIGTTSVAFGTAGLGTITDSDFKEVRKMTLTWDDSTYYHATKFNLTDFDPNETFNKTAPFYYWQGDNIFGIKPEETVGTALIWYYKTPAILDSDGDELPVSMKAYSRSFVDYAVAEAYYKDNKVKEGDRYLARAEAQKERFRLQMDRTKSGSQYMSLREPIEADESFDSLF